MNNFRKFEKIAIRWIALSTFRTTGPWILMFPGGREGGYPIPVPSLILIKIPRPSRTLAQIQQQNMKSHAQFTCFLQLQTDVHNEIKLLTMSFGRTYQCLDRRCKKGGQRQKLSKRCTIVLPDEKSLFHTPHMKVNRA